MYARPQVSPIAAPERLAPAGPRCPALQLVTPVSQTRRLVRRGLLDGEGRLFGEVLATWLREEAP